MCQPKEKVSITYKSGTLMYQAVSNSDCQVAYSHLTWGSYGGCIATQNNDKKDKDRNKKDNMVKCV